MRLTLCNSMGCIVHGILQARILQWVAFPCSRGSSQPRDQTQASRIAGGFLPAEPQGKPNLTTGKLSQKQLPGACASKFLDCGFGERPLRRGRVEGGLKAGRGWAGRNHRIPGGVSSDDRCTPLLLCAGAQPASPSPRPSFSSPVSHVSVQ